MGKNGNSAPRSKLPMNIILETPRLILREMTLDDLDFMAEMMGDAEVMRHYPAPLTREEVRESLEGHIARYRRDGYGRWLAVEKGTMRPVGRVGLVRQEVDGVAEDEVGYMLHRTYWRRGLATEAAAAVRDYAFDKLGISRVIALVRPVNIPSQRTALAIGMKPEKLTMHAGLEHLVFALCRQ
jgi:RimJ/RimL family protein N-acetyltransferase